jgi:hypothetical protein
VLRALVAAGADVEARSKNSKSAVVWAITHKQEEVCVCVCVGNALVLVCDGWGSGPDRRLIDRSLGWLLWLVG